MAECGALIGPEGELCGVPRGSCYEHECRLCGGFKYGWQAFCGAGCCARWEGGERPSVQASEDKK